MAKMVQFRATEKGYYGDIMHVPEGKHELFKAPDDWSASWAVRADGTVPEPVAEVSEDTLAAEALLEGESAAAAEVVAEADINEATGVEVL